MVDIQEEPSPGDAKPQPEDKEVTITEGDLVAKKLIDENKGYRRKNSDLRKDLETTQKERDTLQESKLLEEGKHKEAAEFWKDKAGVLEGKLKDSNSMYASKVVISQVKAKAAEMGCVDLEAMIKLAPMSDLYEDIDEEYNVKPEAVTSMLEMVKQKRDYLFKKAAPKIEDGNPKVNTEDLSSVAAYGLALKRCATQKEFDDLRKKYRKQED